MSLEMVSAHRPCRDRDEKAPNIREKCYGRKQKGAVIGKTEFLAERAGFELTVRFPVYTLSKRARPLGERTGFAGAGRPGGDQFETAGLRPPAGLPWI
jgi:hypothetical protein